MLKFASLWDANYHSRGMALYHSLLKNVGQFFLYVLCFEEETYLKLAPLECVVPVLYGDWKTRALESVRPTRSWVEFLWTLTPFWTHYCLEMFGEVAYVDSDIYFFSDPQPLYDEVKNESIAIIPHRFTPYLRDRLISAGEYNVSWVYFKNTDTAQKCLEQWKAQCLDWCYAMPSGGRYGDQAYLNDWPKTYNAHVVENISAGLAPWNNEQYSYGVDFRVDAPSTLLVEGKPVIFYHFHNLDRGDYVIHPMVEQYLYRPYRSALWATVS